VVGEGIAGAAGGAAPAVPRAEAGSETPDDLAAVLSRALGGLVEQTGAERAAAWARDGSGVLRLLAARVEGAQLAPPSEVAWAEFETLAEPADLGTLRLPVLRALASERGYSAAAPLRADSGELLAVLLLGGSRDPAGAVRPRTLAALSRVATRSLGAAAAVQGLARLARLDDEVRALDRLAAVGGLLAEIVHEIRNPLVSIKTYLHLLGEEDAPDASEFRGVAIEELRRIERLLEMVMQHARSPARTGADAIGEIEPAARSVAQLATLRAAARGIAVELALADELPPARIAPDALRQVLLNLALNAVEACESGATVRISAAPAGDEIAITVDDEGPGVPEALRARLFEPFFSTKSRAGGLGLAISRRLVEEAGGTITIEDRLPRGARFRVTLPLAKP
jgi:signal transduction histidine kinase